MPLAVTYGAVTDRGLNRKRSANEDRFLALPGQGLFLVADGVGGRRGGQVASQTVVDVFAEVFAEVPRGELLPLLAETIARCNQSIFESSGEAAELAGMATTLALLVADGDRAIIGHVGDSRVYRYDGRRLLCETEDHSEVGEAVRAGQLTAAQAARHPRRNIINRALGAEPEVEPDLKTVPLDARTRFLLCSDGVNRHVPDAEIEELLAGGAHPQAICARLKDLCYERGAEDNLTAVVVDLGARAYAEEPTRPSLPRAVPSATSHASRIEVEFGADGALPPPKRKGQAMDHATTSRRGGLLAGGLIQLLVFLALLALSFWAGRRYEEIRGWVTGASEAPAAPAEAGGQSDPELAAARALFEERRYEKARDRFAEFVRRDPANAEYRYWLGRASFETRQYQEAIRQLREAAERDAKLPNVYVHLALAYGAAGDRRGADESLRRALSQ